jgi:molybdenum cofactor cytidylyltransferase
MSGGPRVCAVVLAAGLSRRMGPGVQKLLLPFAGSTVLGHVVRQVSAAPVEHVIVVVGTNPRVAAAAASATAPAMTAESRLTVVVNPNHDGDMLDSARCGLRALPAECDAVLLALGDQPAVTTDVVSKIIDAYGTTGRGIVVPVYHGRRGHPLLFAAGYAPEVFGGYDGVGVRGLLRSHPDDVLEIAVPDPGVADDIDVPSDYDRELARLANSPSSSPTIGPARTSAAPPGRE